MPKKKEKVYRLEIHPDILKLLGPNLYTNIYYILAELIANAYDADAKNVYIISEKNSITVEDDGIGMSYEDTKKYLDVAKETRTTEEESTSESGRRKIGRKGVGKLAALSVSENVLVKTKKDGQKSGFVLSRNVRSDKLLKPLSDNEIKFKRIKTPNATSIEMLEPQYRINKSFDSIKRNLLKIFPLINKKFKIHIITKDGEENTIDNFDKEMIQQLGGLIILGNDFKYLDKYFKPKYPKHIDKLKEIWEEESQKITLKNRFDVKKEYDLIIKGWIGVYETTSGRRIGGYHDFPDNFVSLLANKKLGEYNILTHVARNRLREVYVVGQLHVDLFEETELPDMSLSNRQGYKADDPRYQAVIGYVRDTLLPKILGIRTIFEKYYNEEKNKRKMQKLQEKEKELIEKVDAYKDKVSSKAVKKIKGFIAKKDKQSLNKLKSLISKEMNSALALMKMKQRLDLKRKRILICHTEKDKDLADLVYDLLVFNNVPPEDIIYTTCDDSVSRIPEDMPVYEYLKRFFVDTISTEKIYVMYVASKEMEASWGAVVEVGAGWITKKDHKIFTVKGYDPKEPLDITKEWHTTVVSKKGSLSMTRKEWDSFAVKIESVCKDLGYKCRSRADNKGKVKTRITLTK